MAKILSKRTEVLKNWEDFLDKNMAICAEDQYDEQKNPNGFINLGTGVNNVCCDIICPKLLSNDVWAGNPLMLQYEAGHGNFRLRKAIATLMTEFLHPNQPIDPEDLICSHGVTGTIDLLSHCLADPGDVFLVPSPYYGRIYTDCMQRSLVEIWPIPIITRDSKEFSPILTIEKVQAAYKEAVSKSRTVRGIFLINPSNPLGDVYSPDLLMQILEFGHSHDLHIIIDEIYALSVYVGRNEFHSVLKFPSIPDPTRTHILYGLSKDFGIPGVQVGAIYTKCKEFQHCMKELCALQCIASPIMDIVARYLEDIDFCRSYIQANKVRLTEKFDHCAERLTKMGLNVRKSDAAFFLWVDFRKICGPEGFDQEMDFFKFLMEKFHLYIVPGRENFCEQPGWFRITFSSFPHHVDEGLNRLEKAIKEYKPIKSSTLQ